MEKLTNQDCQTFINLLQNWKQQPLPNIRNTLKRLVKSQLPPQNIEKITLQFTRFHKDYLSVDSVDDQLIDSILQVKGHLKKLDGALKKQKSSSGLPQLNKKPSVSDIEVPKNFGTALSPNRKKILNVLYQNFVWNMKEHLEHQNLRPFLIKVQQYLFQLSKGDSNLILKQAKKICQNFMHEQSQDFKIRMLNGLTKPIDVASNKSEAFLSDTTRQKMMENQKQEMQASNADFFKDHKKKIHSQGIGEQCRFCKQKAAYCDSMKQIRRSDEPMTRFMVCSNCTRQWKD